MSYMGSNRHVAPAHLVPSEERKYVVLIVFQSDEDEFARYKEEQARLAKLQHHNGDDHDDDDEEFAEFQAYDNKTVNVVRCILQPEH